MLFGIWPLDWFPGATPSTATLPALLGWLLTLSLVLVGCSSSAPGTPTVQSSVTSPTSAVTTAKPASTTPSTSGSSGGLSNAETAERWSAVAPAYRASWAAVDAVLKDGGVGAPTADMRRTLDQAQLDYWVSYAQDFASKGWKQTGDHVVVYANPTQVAIGPDTGSAVVEACVDSSAVGAVDANGKALNRTSKNYQIGQATMAWIDGTWKVTGTQGAPTFADSC